MYTALMHRIHPDHTVNMKPRISYVTISIIKEMEVSTQVNS